MQIVLRSKCHTFTGYQGGGWPGDPPSKTQKSHPPLQGKNTPHPLNLIYTPPCFFPKGWGLKAPILWGRWVLVSTSQHSTPDQPSPFDFDEFCNKSNILLKKFACGSHLYGNFLLIMSNNLYEWKKRELLSKYFNSSSANTSSFSFNISCFLVCPQRLRYLADHTNSFILANRAKWLVKFKHLPKQILGKTLGWP